MTHYSIVINSDNLPEGTAWCVDNCKSNYSILPKKDYYDNTDYVIMFADQSEADLFNKTFEAKFIEKMQDGHIQQENRFRDRMKEHVENIIAIKARKAR
jgi:hypothetical protein